METTMVFFNRSQLQIIVACFSLAISFTAASQSPAFELREGERLDGDDFHTWIEMRFEDEKSAKRWLSTNTRYTDFTLESIDGEFVIKIPKIFPNLFVKDPEKDGVLHTGGSINYYSTRKKAQEYRDMKLRDLANRIYVWPYSTYEVKEVQEVDSEYGNFVVDVERTHYAVDEARYLGQREGEILKRLILDIPGYEGAGRYPGETIGPTFDNRMDTLGLATERRAIFELEKGGLIVSVLESVDDYPMCHGLASMLMYKPKIGTQQVGSDHIWYAKGPHLKNGSQSEKYFWQTEGNFAVMLSVNPGTNSLPALKAYLDWYPSRWPLKDQDFDKLDWVRTEIEISQEILFDYVSEPTGHGLRDQLSSHLPKFRNEYYLRAKKNLTRRLVYEFYAIERWVDTPVRQYRAEVEFPVDQARYDSDFKKLMDWWPDHRNDFVLRENAPYFSSSGLSYVDHQLPPEQQRLNDEMLKAVEQGDVRKVVQLVDRGADPDAFKGGPLVSKRRASALAIAIQAKDAEMVQKLIEHGASLDCLRPADDHPLAVAIIYGNAQATKALLDAGSSLDEAVESLHGRTSTLLSVAVGRGDIGKIRLLLQAGIDIDARDENERTALMQAASFGSTKIVKLLLENQASVSLERPGGMTALSYASHTGYLDVCKLLLEAGAKADGNSLVLASRKGHFATVKLLVDADAPLDEKHPVWSSDSKGVHNRVNMTAIEAARDAKHDDVVAFLESAKE